jgi:hypothetical protein
MAPLTVKPCDTIRILKGGEMAKKRTKERGFTAPRGEKMKPGKAWRLMSPGGRGFKATLVRRLDIGRESVAIFRVIRPSKEKPAGD